MAGSLNKATLIGNLGRDPEARTLTNGGRVVNLAVATSETWNDKQSGERQERTQWHNVVIYNEKLGEVAERYLTKGRKVYIEGAIESRKYVDKDGVEKYITEIVLKAFRGELQILDSKGDADAGERPSGGREDRGRGDDRGGARGGYDRGASRGGYGRDDRSSYGRGGGNGAGREAPRDDRREAPRGAPPPRGRDEVDDDPIPF